MDLTIRGVTRTLPLHVLHHGEWKTPFWLDGENKGEITRAGFEANTLSQLRRALIAADKSQGFVIIDVRVDRDDLSPVTVKYIKAAAKRSQAPRLRAATKGAGQ